MNYLVDNFPFEINSVPIDADFRRMVQFELLMTDDDVPPADKVALALNLLYKKPVPDVEEAWNGLLWFYSCGTASDDDGSTKTSSSVNKAYDFEVDSERIYSAFIKEYGIDLQESPIHWWKFKALLISLPDTCTMGKLMYYRTVDISTLKGKEREHAQKIRSMFPAQKIIKMSKAQREAQWLAKLEKREKEIKNNMKERD